MENYSNESGNNRIDTGIVDMTQESIDSLELFSVFQGIAEYAKTESGAKAILDSEPCPSLSHMTLSLQRIADLREVIGLDGPLAFGQFPPLEGLLARLANKAVIFDAEDLMVLADMIETSTKIRSALLSLDEKYGTLIDLGNRIRNLDHFSVRVRSVLDEHGVVRSNASKGLQQVRGRMRRSREKIQSALNSVVKDEDLARVVQEDYITIRNDRYVILLKPEFKGLFKGIVHDHSRSGASVYVEPLGVVDINNEIASLADEERSEVRKVFQELTSEARESIEELKGNYETLVLLDALQAKSLYAQATDSIEPELVDKGFKLLGAKHPLLPFHGPEAAKPMDVIMTPESDGMIISGANMGGKTVALKIAGLFPLMVRYGLMIPAKEGTKVQPFGKIMADIGDDQDIQGKVSSFSGHMARIGRILEFAQEDTLALLDELGGATDPDEGSALAMAVIDELMAKGAKAIVTTHLTQLKAYAMGSKGVKSVSVEFHPVTLHPTYRLLYDLPGESHAIATAERIGIPERVIERSRKYLHKTSGGASQLMMRLKEKIDEVDRLKTETQELERDLKSKLEALESEKEQALEFLRKQGLDIINRAKHEVTELQKALKTGKIRDASKPRRVIENLEEELEDKLGGPLESPQESPLEGARAYVKPLGRVAVVEGPGEKGKVMVRLGNVKTRVNIEDLEILGDNAEKNASKNEQVRIHMPTAAARGEVNIIGFRVEDALPVVEKALDEALVAGLETLTIIHGKGEGRLKKAVREHFQGIPYVKKLYGGPIDSGGDGQTVLELSH